MIIGLSGYAGVGKDAVAHCLESLGHRRASFADPIRHALLVLDPIVKVYPPSAGRGDVHILRLSEAVKNMGWESAKRNLPEVRPLLQRLGTEVGRQMIDNDIWVNLLIRGIHPDAVVTDVRFRNEADALRKEGAEIWRVTRPGYGPANDHSSETELDDYDFDVEIVNDGNLDQLATKVSRARMW